MEECCVFFAVRTEFVIILKRFGFKGLIAVGMVLMRQVDGQESAFRSEHTASECKSYKGSF
jgi:hypothetical protein